MVGWLGRSAVLTGAVIVCAASAKDPTYSVRRSALVPHVAPPARTGQPVDGQAQVAFANSTVLMPAAPREQLDANAGLHIARTNFSGGLRFGMGNFDLGPLVEVAPESGAMEINDDFPGSPEGPAIGYGVSTYYSAVLNESWRLGIGVDGLLYRIPYFEQGTCVANCFGAPMSYQEHGTHNVGVFGASVTPSWRMGPWVWFATLSVRNHPSNLKGEVQTLTENTRDDSHEVNGGPAYMTAAAGASLTVAKGFDAFVQVFQPLTRDPVIYGPSVGVGVTASWGAR